MHVYNAFLKIMHVYYNDFLRVCVYQSLKIFERKPKEMVQVSTWIWWEITYCIVLHALMLEFLGGAELI